MLVLHLLLSLAAYETMIACVGVVESKQKRRSGHLVEFFKLHQRVTDAERLQEFVTGADLAKRIVAAEDDDLSTMHRSATQLVGQLGSLKAKYVCCGQKGSC